MEWAVRESSLIRTSALWALQVPSVPSTQPPLDPQSAVERLVIVIPSLGGREVTSGYV